MTNEMNQNQMNQTSAEQQQNITQQNAQNAQQQAQQSHQMQQAQLNQTQTTQYKVVSSFRDAQDQKVYSVGETFQSTDQSRVQELLDAHVIAEEIPQVELLTTDPALNARNQTRKANAKKAEQAAAQAAQNQQAQAQNGQAQNTQAQNQGVTQSESQAQATETAQPKAATRKTKDGE